MMKKSMQYLIIGCSLFVFTTCIEPFTADKIKGQAIIVDNFKDRNPLEGLNIEVEYTNDEGYSYDFLSSSITDENGYFEIDTDYKAGFLGLDSWAIANVYTDIHQGEKLGSFRFQFPEGTYKYKTIHLDTFSLQHHVWLVPVIKDLGDYQPDEISIDFYNGDLVDATQKNMTFSNDIAVNQTFPPVEMKMTMNMQHWLSFGTRELARGSLRLNSQEVGFGYFKLEDAKHTCEGDTLYLEFMVEVEE